MTMKTTQAVKCRRLAGPKSLPKIAVMTRSGKTIEQMQETLHAAPDLARGLEASLLAPALLSQGAPHSGALALS